MDTRKRFVAFATALLFAISASVAQAQIIILPCELDPDCQNPVVIVPGILISLNLKTTVLDQEGGTWDFAPGTRAIYRALTERLEAAISLPGQAVYVAHYDWRQPNGESVAEYLIPAIEEAKAETGATKVDIVAHSMGGLVAREYIQGNNYNNDVDELVLIGTPNLGASDAYLAWEGGQLPARWGPLTRTYLDLIENSLQSIHGAGLLQRPVSLRTFFPSLRDLLPISDFVQLDSQIVPNSELTERNFWLEQLQNTVNLIDEREVSMTSIAGTGVQTLDTVPVTEDTGLFNQLLDQLLQRWRDGHPNPDPPQTDTTTGDQTVLTSSAHIGTSNITIPNAIHDKLPEEAQEEVLQALDLDDSGVHLAYDLPDSVLGTVVLSPIDPVIHGPNGEILSASTNTFPDAEFVADTDPNGPKLLTILNPPTGDYQLELTGTGEGEYTVITSYADEDETTSTEQEGTTSTGATTTTSFSITEDTFVPEPAEEEDLRTLLEQLHQAVHDLYDAGHMTPHAFRRLHKDTNRLLTTERNYTRASGRHGADSPQAQRSYEKLEDAFAQFSIKLDIQIAEGALDTTAIETLTGLRGRIASTL